MACERVVMSKSKLVDKNVAILRLLSKKLSEHVRNQQRWRLCANWIAVVIQLMFSQCLYACFDYVSQRRLGLLSVNFRLSEDEVEVLGKVGQIVSYLRCLSSVCVVIRFAGGKKIKCG